MLRKINLRIEQSTLWCYEYHHHNIMEVTTGNIHIKQLFCFHLEELYALFFPRIRPWVIKSIQKLFRCWSDRLGFLHYTCITCGFSKFVFFTCKSKICNSCSKPASDKWISKLLSRLPLYLNYFHITFTIPEQLRNIFLKYRDKWILKLLFKAAQQTINEYYQTQKCLPWYFLILHTFGSDTKRNCHIHWVATSWWITEEKTRKELDYIHFSALNTRWKHNLLNLIQSFLKEHNPDDLYYLNFCINQHSKEYNRYVRCDKKITSIYKVINYVWRYLFRPPFSETRIEHYDWEYLSFTYQHKKPKEIRHAKLWIIDFLCNIMRHLPDKNFINIHYWWIFANRCKAKHLNNLVLIVAFSNKVPKIPYIPTSYRQRFLLAYHKDPFICPCCNLSLQLTNIHFAPKLNSS